MITVKDLQNLLPEFISHLNQTNSSRSTVKNYSSDLRRLFEKLPADLPIDSNHLDQAFNDLRLDFSEATIRRFSYSLKAFTLWLNSQGLVFASKNSPVVTTSRDITVSPIESFVDHIKAEGAPEKTAKLYGSDLNSFFSWLKPAGSALNQGVINKVSRFDINRYTSFLRSKQVSSATINRYLYSLKGFFNFHKEDIVYETNPVTIKPSSEKQVHFWQKFKIKKPRWWHAYRGHPMSDYVNYAAFAAITLFIGLVVFLQLFPAKPIDITNLRAEIQKGLVLAATPPRVLSFQGRLADENGTPVTTNKTIVFKIYDAESAGTLLWTSKNWSVTPDSNGIFSVCLGGQDTGDDCLLDGIADTAIGDAIFRDNAATYLDITVAGQNLSPRQRIASSPYALNSDNLDGIDSTGFVQIEPAAAQSAAGTTTLIHLDETGASTPDLIDLKVATASQFKVTNGGNVTLTGTLNTNTFNSTTLTFSGAAPAISASTAGTNISLNAGTTGKIQIASSSTGDVEFAGGFGSTGCSITSAGALSCNSDGTFGGNLTIQGTTGITFNTGAGGDITFANGEKIDNDANGTIAITGDLDVSGVATFGSAGSPNVGKAVDIENTFTSSANCVFNCYGIFMDNAVNNPTNPNGYVGVYSRVTAADAAYTLSNSYNFYSANPVDGGASVAITNAYGIYIEPVTSATTTNVGLCFDCDGTWSSNTVGAGIQWGTDASAVNLYRSDVNTLKTDDTVNLGAADYNTDANGVLYTTTAGVLTQVVETETASQCLLSGAGASGVPVWGACPGGTFSGDVFSTTNQSLTFSADDGTPPTGTDVSLYRDSTGDLSANALSGRTVNLQIAGADEYNFSATGLAFNSNNITGLGTNLTATAGLTIASAGAGNDITLDGADQVIINDNTVFNTDVDMTFAGTENLAITSDLGGTVNAISLIGTPSASAGTTQGLFIQQANSANTNGLDVGIKIDNADADLALTTGISLTNTGGGKFTTGLDIAGAYNPIHLDATRTTIAVSEAGILVDGTITKDSVTESFYALSNMTTVNIDADPGTFGGDLTFRDAHTTIIDSAINVASGSTSFFTDQTLRVSGANIGTRTITNNSGAASSINLENTGSGTTTLTLTNYNGFLAAAHDGTFDGSWDANTTVTNYSGFYMTNANKGSGTLTNQFGLYLENLTSGTNNYGICFDCDGTYNSAVAANGITWGTDNAVTLYRSAADTLKTDDNFNVNGVFNVSTAGDTTITMNSATGTDDVIIDTTYTGSANKGVMRINYTNNGTATTDTLAIFSNINGGSGTTERLLQLQNLDDSTVTDGILISSNNATGGTITNGITFFKGGAGSFTQEILLQNGETIGNSVDGTINLGTTTTLTAAGALTLSSGGSSGLTLDSASGRATVATGDFLSLGVSGVTGAAAGDIWYDTAAGKFKINEAGGTPGTKTLCNLIDAGCGAGGASALDTITAATTDDTALTNADFTIEWNWALSSATSKGITIGESAASTAGGGDQHILRLDTASGSTAGPLEIVSNSADGGDIEFNLNSAGDIEFQDAGTAFLTLSDTSVTTWTLPAASTRQIIIDQAASDSTLNSATQGVIDINIDTSTNSITNAGLLLNYQATTTAGAGTYYGARILLVDSTVSAGTDSVYGLEILKDAAGGVQGTEALLRLYNQETGAGNSNVLNGLLIESDQLVGGSKEILDAIDVSDVNISNGINLGGNFALFSGIRMFDSGTVLTVEDTSGNDLATFTDNGTTGSLAITNNLSVTGTTITFSGLTNCGALATNSSGVVQCGGATGDTATFTDNSSLPTPVDGTGTEYWNDATRPNITPNSTSQTVLISVYVRATLTGTTDVKMAARLVREDDDSSAPECDGTDPQIGGQLTGANNALTSEPAAILSATFLNAPASTSAVYYTVCSHGDQINTAATINEVTVTLVELGADLAENYYTTDDSVTAGHLVTMDPTIPAGAKKSTTASDSQILGVISTAPGKVLDDYIGRSFGRPVPVALSGRVPVKVNGENGPIQIGDLITSSSTPGVGMKATRAGYVIGRAMTAFSGEGEGLVMVFINTHYSDPERLSQTKSETATSSAKLNLEALNLFSLDSDNNLVASISASAKFIWKNTTGQVVAWISDTGEALFIKVTALVGDFGKLVFGEAVVKKEAKTAGEANFAAGGTEVFIESAKVTQDSLINLTASTKTNGLSLYIKEKRPGEGFVVALERNSGDQPEQATASATQAIKFTWFILNQE